MLCVMYLLPIYRLGPPIHPHLPFRSGPTPARMLGHGFPAQFLECLHLPATGTFAFNARARVARLLVVRVPEFMAKPWKL